MFTIHVAVMRFVFSSFAKRQRGAALRLRSGMERGAGHVAVIATALDEARGLARRALEELAPFAVFNVHATAEDPLADVDQDLGLTAQHSEVEREQALRASIVAARDAGQNIFAVVHDADEACAEELERTRMALECVPDAIERIRMVLAGTEKLEATLTQPAAGALASRIGTHVRLSVPRPERPEHTASWSPHVAPPASFPFWSRFFGR